MRKKSDNKRTQETLTCQRIEIFRTLSSQQCYRWYPIIGNKFSFALGENCVQFVNPIFNVQSLLIKLNREHWGLTCGVDKGLTLFFAGVWNRNKAFKRLLAKNGLNQKSMLWCNFVMDSQSSNSEQLIICTLPQILEI